MCELRFDHHDAWSRFHHQRRVLELALEGLSISNNATDEFDDLVGETIDDTVEREEILEGWRESQILEHEIARRILLQSLVASIYGTFEFSIIQLFANYEQIADGQSSIDHGPGIDLSENKSFIKALRNQGIEISTYPGYDRIELARQIRHAIMHRGGLVDLNMSEEQKALNAALLCALNQNWLISGKPFAESDSLVQIDIDPAFVSNLLSVCMEVIDRTHHELLAKLEARACACAK